MVPIGNPECVVVALLTVLGLGSVVIPGIPILNTRGSRAMKPAKVSLNRFDHRVLLDMVYVSVTFTEIPAMTTTATTTSSSSCPKCGTNRQSGTRSCCAPGGAWVGNCGDPGDSNFEHTWFEGNEACKSKFELI